MTQQKAGREGPWLYDRRVRWLLELTIDEDEHVRFGIEGIDSQCIIALDERLLVIKPGFVRGGVFGAKAASRRDGDGTDFGGKVASIRYGDITSIETKVASSNSVIKINALDYRLNQTHNEIRASERFHAIRRPDQHTHNEVGPQKGQTIPLHDCGLYRRSQGSVRRLHSWLSTRK